MYWDKAGQENTEKTINLAVKRAKELGIEDFVVASNTGQTVLKLLEHSVNNIVCVTHQVGFRNPGEDEMGFEMRERLQKAGVKILTTTHLFAGVDRALRYQFGGLYPAEIIAMSLRMLGQGVKVGVEIAVMALDAGLIPYGKDVIAIGGTGQGADTAILIKPEHSAKIFKTQIKEIICKPKA
ncbi:hypothetical protein BBF96_06715 [Anoxybacter fermentans]|uniref:Pyruvate kinase C-terminal domain-containing protein n=1 Tax=Anoxybacter fermentans TaxID=1323375 RepID=A0A3S9SXY7_9FIRM|nr:pyruvate kinase alpha/beta domain-containing protein [Anoxybacter fermentans]AZR73102.1 hypothetical protein BBF96_06715 [Anoxybacter fermentans]